MQSRKAIMKEPASMRNLFLCRAVRKPANVKESESLGRSRFGNKEDGRLGNL